MRLWPQLFKRGIAQLVSVILILWIKIYSIYCAIQHLNNWGLVGTLLSVGDVRLSIAILSGLGGYQSPVGYWVVELLDWVDALTLFNWFLKNISFGSLDLYLIAYKLSFRLLLAAKSFEVKCCCCCFAAVIMLCGACRKKKQCAVVNCKNCVW